MQNYTLTAGNSNTGYSKLTVQMGRAPRTGAMVATFPKGWRKGLKAQHAQALHSAAQIPRP